MRHVPLWPETEDSGPEVSTEAPAPEVSTVSPNLVMPPEERPLDILAVLDQSGSMESCVSDTLGGFNAFLREHRDAVKRGAIRECRVSLVLFSTTVERRYENVRIEEVADLSTADYHPGGGTALLDAMGNAISAHEAAGSPHHRKLLLLLTDGQENSSKEWILDGIRSLVQRLEKAGMWTFVYLGADPAAFTTASDLGISLSNTVNYVGGQSATVMHRAARKSVETYSAADFGGKAEASTRSFFDPAEEAKLAAEIGLSRPDDPKDGPKEPRP